MASIDYWGISSKGGSLPIKNGIYEHFPNGIINQNQFGQHRMVLQCPNNVLLFTIGGSNCRKWVSRQRQGHFQQKMQPQILISIQKDFESNKMVI